MRFLVETLFPLFLVLLFFELEIDLPVLALLVDFFEVDFFGVVDFFDVVDFFCVVDLDVVFFLVEELLALLVVVPAENAGVGRRMESRTGLAAIVRPMATQSHLGSRPVMLLGLLQVVGQLTRPSAASGKPDLPDR